MAELRWPVGQRLRRPEMAAAGYAHAVDAGEIAARLRRDRRSARIANAVRARLAASLGRSRRSMRVQLCGFGRWPIGRTQSLAAGHGGGLFGGAAATALARPSQAQPDLERLTDEFAPAFGTGERTRGVATLRAQSRCAFRGFAETRLRFQRLERPVPGFNDRERGELIHHALEHVWSVLRDSSSLLS